MKVLNRSYLVLSQVEMSELYQLEEAGLNLNEVTVGDIDNFQRMSYVFDPCQARSLSPNHYRYVKPEKPTS